MIVSSVLDIKSGGNDKIMGAYLALWKESNMCLAYDHNKM